MYNLSVKTPTIERYMGLETRCPALPVIAQSHHRSARDGLARHKHTFWEVCFITNGEAEWFMEQQIYRLAPGSVFVTPPGVEHGSVGGFHQPYILSWFQLDLRKLTDKLLIKNIERMSHHVWLDIRLEELLTLHAQLLGECRYPKLDSSRISQSLLNTLICKIIRAANEIKQRRPIPVAMSKMLAFSKKKNGSSDHAGRP